MALPAAPLLLIDGLNVAYWCGDPPTLRLPLALMSGLLERGFPARLYFDASAAYRLQDDAAIYAQLVQHELQAVQVPSGRRADGEMLKHARAQGGCIVSRDRFRDYRSRYRRLIDDPSRVLEGYVEADRIRVPALAVSTPLPASAWQAWETVERLLSRA